MALVAPPLVAAGIAGAGCAETRRSLGDDCLKNEDCLSGVCSALHCAAAPPLLDGEAEGDAATTDAPPDVAKDAPGDAPADAPPDAPAEGG